jgi:complex iron-sulfur molybdoenzyme family reductase subunit gamma
MKKFAKTVILTSLFCSASLVASHINAMKVPGNVADIGPSSKAWLSTSYTDVIVYPQTTVQMIDKEANELNNANKAKIIKVKALYDGKNISFLIKWKDGTKSVQMSDSTTSYGDGFALQFPQNYENTQELPYIGMGSMGRAVIVHLTKATQGVYEPDGEKDVYHQVSSGNQNLFAEDLKAYEDEVAKKITPSYQRDFISEGFRAMTQIKDSSTKANTHMSYDEGYWKGALSRELKANYLDLDKGAFPIALAIWDGDKKNRDGLKHLSGWVSVKLVGKSGGDELIDTLAAKPMGDVANGQKLALENCAACHRYGEEKSAPDFMAPDLSNIGGYATKEYLAESINKPSAVIVPGYNRNAHRNFEWYSVDDKGVRTSTMPAYDWMDEKSRDDLVAFFSTMKAEVE